MAPECTYYFHLIFIIRHLKFCYLQTAFSKCSIVAVVIAAVTIIAAVVVVCGDDSGVEHQASISPCTPVVCPLF